MDTGVHSNKIAPIGFVQISIRQNVVLFDLEGPFSKY